MQFQIFINKVSNGSVIEIRSYLNESTEVVRSIELVCQHHESSDYQVEKMIADELSKIYRSMKEAERADNQPAEEAKDVGGSDNGTLAAHGTIVIHI